MSAIKKLWWLSLAIGGAALLVIFLLKDARFTNIGLNIASVCALVQTILICLTPTFNLKFGRLKRELLSMTMLYLIVFIMAVIAFFQERISGIELFFGGYLTLAMALVPFGIVYLKLQVDD